MARERQRLEKEERWSGRKLFLKVYHLQNGCDSLIDFLVFYRFDKIHDAAGYNLPVSWARFGTVIMRHAGERGSECGQGGGRPETRPPWPQQEMTHFRTDTEELVSSEWSNLTEWLVKGRTGVHRRGLCSRSRTNVDFVLWPHCGFAVWASYPAVCFGSNVDKWRACDSKLSAFDEKVSTSEADARTDAGKTLADCETKWKPQNCRKHFSFYQNGRGGKWFVDCTDWYNSKDGCVDQIVGESSN